MNDHSTRELIDEQYQYKLLFKKLDPNAIIPTKAKKGDLGYDLYALEHINTYRERYRDPEKTGVYKIRTGIACKLPTGFGAFICNRSGFSTKKDAHVTAGVIDNGYTGELIVAMRANILNAVLCEPGERIAQLVLIPLISVQTLEVDELPSTERGSGGFGSTDKINQIDLI